MEARTRRFGLAGRTRIHAVAHHALCEPCEHIGERPRDVLPQDMLIRLLGKTCGGKARQERVLPAGLDGEKGEMKRYLTSRGRSSRAARLASCAVLLAADAGGGLYIVDRDSRPTRKADSSKLVTSISGTGEHRFGVGCGQSHAARCGSDQ